MSSTVLVVWASVSGLLVAVLLCTVPGHSLAPWGRGSLAVVGTAGAGLLAFQSMTMSLRSVWRWDSVTRRVTAPVPG